MLRSRCACGKVQSSTLEESRLVHAQVWAARGGEPVRYYQCHWGSWHWTRSPLRTKTTNKKAV